MSRIIGRSTSKAYRPASNEDLKPAKTLGDRFRYFTFEAVNLPGSDLGPQKTRPGVMPVHLPRLERGPGKCAMKP